MKLQDSTGKIVDRRKVYYVTIYNSRHMIVAFLGSSLHYVSSCNGTCVPSLEALNKREMVLPLIVPMFNCSKLNEMNENLILTKDSVPSDIERYFRGVLALDQQDKVFSVNLDDVWQLAYSRKDNAVRALKANFMENVDYIAIQKSENSSLPQNAEQD